MPDPESLRPIQESGYLVEAYAAASEQLEEPGLKSAVGAAGTLCDALSRLSEDAAFWAQVINLLPEIEDRQQELGSLGAEFSEFLAVEYEALVAAECDPGVAQRLISDVVLGVTLVGEAHTGAAVETLRSSLERLRDATCLLVGVEEAADPKDTAARLFRVLDIVKRGVLVVGGGGLVVGNGIAFVHGAIDGDTTLASVRDGLTAMTIGLMRD
jgi:hypothetical protein